MAKKRRGNIITDALETLVEPVTPIPKDVAKGVASVVDINSFLYGPSENPDKPEVQHKKTEKAVKEFGVDEKTRKENEKMKANHTPLDVQALRDKQQLQQIQKRLFDLQISGGNEARKKADEKEIKRKQDVEQEEEQKKKEKEQTANAAPPEDAHGKSKQKLGQARKKATADTHEIQELKANKGK